MRDFILQGGFIANFSILMAIFLSRTIAIAGGARLWTQNSATLRKRKVVLAEHEKTDWKSELDRGLYVLALDALVSVAAVTSGVALVDLDPSWAKSIVTFLALFVWMEIYFYFLHRALHHPKLFWIHRAHHEGHGTTPFTSLSFSFVERLLLLAGSVGVPALFSHLISIPLQAWGTYFLVNFILNVYGHMNSEILPPRLLHSPLTRWMNTSVSHGLHHLRYRGHYALFTPFLDRWMGTEFKDYPQRLDQVLAGGGAEVRNLA